MGRAGTSTCMQPGETDDSPKPSAYFINSALALAVVPMLRASRAPQGCSGQGCVSSAAAILTNANRSNLAMFGGASTEQRHRPRELAVPAACCAADGKVPFTAAAQRADDKHARARVSTCPGEGCLQCKRPWQWLGAHASDLRGFRRSE